MNRRLILMLTGGLTCAGLASGLQAGTISVPNASFESPTTPFASPNIDAWQKTAQPTNYNAGGGFLWSQLTGAFKNTAPGGSDHIDNCDGAQAIWLFNVPEVGLFQDYDSTNSVPPHAFNVTYEVGKAYHMTVGIIGTGGNMPQGATLELSLYYRDASSNMIPVAVTSVTNLFTVFSNNTHFVDCSVHVPEVKATDAWAGQHLGIQFLSRVITNFQGGYWDLDNVRLTSTQQPFITNPLWTTNREFQATLTSEVGQFDILATTNLAVALSSWDNIGMVTNMTGTISFTDTNAIQWPQRFYRARQSP